MRPMKKTKIPKFLKIGRVIVIFVCLTKIPRIFENIFSNLIKIWRSCFFFANILNFTVEMVSEIQIWCYRGSGWELFFSQVFDIFSRGQNWDSPQNFCLLDSFVSHLLLPSYRNLIKKWSTTPAHGYTLAFWDFFMPPSIDVDPHIE